MKIFPEANTFWDLSYSRERQAFDTIHGIITLYAAYYEVSSDILSNLIVMGIGLRNFRPLATFGLKPIHV